MIKNGERLLIDFDGVIAEANRPDGTSWYPEFGPPIPGIYEFLQKCKEEDIIVEIWTARTNYDKNFPENMQGHNAMLEIRDYMAKHNLYYTSFLLTHKPIGSHPGAAKWFLDDRTLNLKNGFDYFKALFG